MVCGDGFFFLFFGMAFRQRFQMADRTMRLPYVSTSDCGLALEIGAEHQ